PAAAQAAPDELDAARERLERALAEERQKSAALRASVDGLQFKLDVLEKSYAKQLADARQHAEAAARTPAERDADLAGGAGRRASAWSARSPRNGRSRPRSARASTACSSSSTCSRRAMPSSSPMHASTPRPLHGHSRSVKRTSRVSPSDMSRRNTSSSGR